MKKFIKKLKSPLGLAVIALLLVAGTVAGSIKAAQKYGAVTFDVNNGGYVNLTLEGIADQFGAFITSGTNFTDVAISNDLTVAGATSLTGDLTAGAITASGEVATQGFTQGGGCTASTTVAATELWTEADLLGSNCFEYNGATAAAITITLPATSTMTTLIPNAGDMRTWLYQGYTAAATTTTWTAGTGIDLIAYTTNDDVIDGNEYAEITCTRMIDTDVTCIVSELVHAD